MTRLIRTLALIALGWSLSPSLEGGNYNGLIVESIGEMPSGGVYAKYDQNRKFRDLHQTVVDLNSAVRTGLMGQLKVSPAKARQYSFCSSATYLLFVKVIEQLQSQGKIELSPAVNRELSNVGSEIEVIGGKLDGVGIFGHWNADGPGTAVLFHRLKLGTNFSDFKEARPGDFMKIFWNNEIGKGERGHLVVYLGANSDFSSVRVWSSNLRNDNGGGGYGEMWVERSRIKRVVFSRLESPENLNRWSQFSEAEQTSDYLVRIRKTGSTSEEMKRATGILD